MYISENRKNLTGGKGEIEKDREGSVPNGGVRVVE